MSYSTAFRKKFGYISFIYHGSYVAQTFSLCPIPPHFVKFGNATSFFRIGIMSERPPGRDPPNTIRTFGVSYYLNRRFARITPTQKSVTSGNPPSKQIWFIAIPTTVLALLRCPPATGYLFLARDFQCFQNWKTQQ